MSKSGSKQGVAAREVAVSHREASVRAREHATGEHEVLVKDREEMIHLREDAVRAREEAVLARSEAVAANLEREQLLLHMREANERLVLATLRADEAAESEQAANRAKDDFLAMLGHELRNPLTPISTALDVMTLRDPTMFEKERALIGRQVKNLVRLVDDLLDVARITQGKIELARRPVELASVVAQAIEVVSPLLESKAHTLTVNVAARGLVINADPIRLTQVVGNLLTNAAKFTPSGGRIAVTGERRGENVVLSVRDSGIGLSVALLPRVFERFVQEPQASDRSRGGLGLGLTIVRSLVTMHGGSVSARSEGIGAGSEFVVELPATSEAPGKITATAAMLGAVEPRKILVVDDNRDIAEGTRLLLAQRGHDVRTAFDGPSALAVVKEFRPDVALLDIGLPLMDGYELGSKLRAAVDPHDVRLIAVTGYGQVADHDRSADAGFALHLVKPVALVELLAGIESIRA